MMIFAELLSLGAFGDLRLLRVHLQDRYDFGYLLRATLDADAVPHVSVASRLEQAGYATMDRTTKVYSMYGVGEFKATGEDVFTDFDAREPRKSPDTPDLLVCWSFNTAAVEEQSWSVEQASLMNSEIPGQTHVWLPGGKEFPRSRPLAIIALESVIQQLVTNDKLASAPVPWPDRLPKSYL